MKRQVGLWIDHRKAVIVDLRDGEEELKKITSNMEKHDSSTGDDGSGEDVRDRKFGNHLNSYYDEVIAYIRDADSIQIFGPGEAKGELETRIKREGLKAQILPVETVDKMTDRQISAKVRGQFLPKSGPGKGRQEAD
ncbi:MAG: hypothetical protein ABIU06_04060 [Anaerolineales bacterium]